tara:strand:+ start:128 stop:301 length:174 start_codon:yes stop_codon:yes gene_type:complete
MKKLLLIFIFTACCVSKQTQNNSSSSNLVFSDKLTLDEFKIKLEVYSNNSPYPNIDN